MNIFHLGVILIIMSGFFLFEDRVYAMWVPLSQQQLMEQSKTIFVGNVTAVTPVDVQYQSQWMKNDTMKQSVGPETMTLDEYTVHVEEFLQNPQNYDTIKLRQATVPGLPTGPALIDGFQVGDRVLFYLPKYENQTHFPMQYLPESFKIPQSCNGQDVLVQKRIIGSNNFTVIQDGIKISYDNFTVDKPIKFRYEKDMNTLFGKSFDVEVIISDATGAGNQPVFSQKINAGSEPCQWVTIASWDFTPKQVGKYIMTILTKDGNRTSEMSQIPFYVKLDATHDTNNISIQNISTQPNAVKVGDVFNITATLVNNSQNPILIDGNPPCVNTVVLDSHVTVDAKAHMGCFDGFLKHTIDPGENFTMSYPDYSENFRALSTGTANATVTLSYFEGNQTVHSKTISKSFQFLIHDLTLQDQLDQAKRQTEIQQQSKLQLDNLNNTMILVEAGLPIAAGISVGVFLFHRKRK